MASQAGSKVSYNVSRTLCWLHFQAGFLYQMEDGPWQLQALMDPTDAGPEE